MRFPYFVSVPPNTPSINPRNWRNWRSFRLALQKRKTEAGSWAKLIRPSIKRLTYAEIAERLGLSLMTVYTHLRKKPGIIGRLRRRLGLGRTCYSQHLNTGDRKLEWFYARELKLKIEE